VAASRNLKRANVSLIQDVLHMTICSYLCAIGIVTCVSLAWVILSSSAFSPEVSSIALVSIVLLRKAFAGIEFNYCVESELIRDTKQFCSWEYRDCPCRALCRRDCP